jgi:hypothetical protein
MKHWPSPPSALGGPEEQKAAPFGMTRIRDVGLGRIVLLAIAAIVLVAGVSWAFAMPPHYAVPAEGPPFRVNDTGTRVAVAILSAAFAAVLIVFAASTPKPNSNGS